MSAPAPFFQIIGAGRSGTSLLSCLIDAHSRCCVDPERFSPLLMEEFEGVDGGAAGATQRIDNYLNACRARAPEVPGKIWGHKATVEQICGLRHFRANIEPANRVQSDMFIERASSLPIVFVVRDGRGCISSKLTRTDQSLEQAIARWKFAVEFQQKMQRACSALILVKYEELVRDPVRELTRVGQFLGFDYESAMLTGVNSDKLQPEYRREGFDVVELADDPPWVGEIAAELKSLGYSEPSRAA